MVIGDIEVGGGFVLSISHKYSYTGKESNPKFSFRKV